MKVYISGKIGEEVLSKSTHRKFALAEQTLQARGFETFNPTTSGFGKMAEEDAERNESTFWEEIIIYDLNALKSCQAIYLLEDYKDSPGALTEVSYAKGSKKHFFYASKKHAALHLSDQWNATHQERMSVSEAAEKLGEYINEHINEVWIPLL
ncbi:MAG: DUF4406 domain-containing protein [Prevotella sp.]|nr:DUF4406 domain-containing protein [Prevotella sp.]